MERKTREILALIKSWELEQWAKDGTQDEILKHIFGLTMTLSMGMVALLRYEGAPVGFGAFIFFTFFFGMGFMSLSRIIMGIYKEWKLKRYKLSDSDKNYMEDLRSDIDPSFIIEKVEEYALYKPLTRIERSKYAQALICYYKTMKV